MYVAFALLCIGLTAYFSTLSYVLRAYSRGRVAAFLDEAHGGRWLPWLDRHEEELQALTSLVRTALNLTVLLNFWLWYQPARGNHLEWLSACEAFGLTLLVLAVAAVAIPHAVALHAGERVLASSFGLLWTMRTVCWPLGRLFMAFEALVRYLLGKSAVTEEEETQRAEEEILEAVSEGEAYGAVDEEQKEMIRNVIALDKSTASEIMTPRTAIDALPITASYEDVRALILKTGHSRIPVYETSLDQIVGVVYAKDLLRLDPHSTFDLRALMRVPPYVPETKTLDDLLAEFRANKVQIAIVLDEFGGTAGLVTIEDVLEELVGEIDDEYDQAPAPQIARVDDTTLEVDARVPVADVSEALRIELPETEDYETIGGFVNATLGRIPATGETFEHENMHFTIVSAEPRRINRLRIKVQPTVPQATP